MRAVAGAEPPAVFTLRIAGFLAERHAAEMSTDTEEDQPFRFLRPVRIRLGIEHLIQRNRTGGLDFLNGA